MSVLEHDAPLPATDAPDGFDDGAASERRPFVGLRSFTYEDHPFFFGRTEQVAVLERALRRDRLLSVVGSSGSGKSSLIRAGLLPLVERRGLWNWVEMRPGEAPIRRLAEALARPNVSSEHHDEDPLAEARADRIDLILRESSFGISDALRHTPFFGDKRLVILVDQFEEVFRFADLRAQQGIDAERAHDQRDEATLFVQLILAAREDPAFAGRIVLTMRSDFIGDCARFHGLSEAVTATQYLVPALTRDQRAQAIRGPVEAAGAEIEPAVVQRLLNDTNEDPDQLPVMQHALMRCWQCAAARHHGAGPVRLTVADYAAVGGVERALSLHADEILDELDRGDDAGQALPMVVQRMFQSLTDTDSKGRIIRRPQKFGALLAVLAPDDAPPETVRALRQALQRVVGRFADPNCSFLRAAADAGLADDAPIDIGHEALIRRWDRLGAPNERNWVREEQEDAEKLNHLVRLAQFGGAITEGELAEFEAWWAIRRPNRFWARRYARDGVDRLQAAADVLEAARVAARAKARERRRARTIRIAAIALIGALVAALGGLMLLKAKAEAALARESVERANTANSRLISVIGFDQLQRESAHKGLLIALYGMDRMPALREYTVLAYRALERMRETRILRFERVRSVAFLPDGRLLTLAGGKLLAWDLADDKAPPQEIADLKAEAFDLAVSADGHKALVGTIGQEARLIDLDGGGAARYAPLGGDDEKPGGGSFSPDGRYVVTASRISAPKLWRLGEGTQARKVADLGVAVEDLRGGGMAAAFSGDSKRFVVGSEDGRVFLFDTESHQKLKELPFPAGAKSTKVITALAFSPVDPNLVLVVYFSGGAYLWRLDTETSQVLHGSEANTFRGAFSPDGQMIAMGTHDGAALYRTARPHAPPVTLQTGGGVWSLAFSRTTPYRLATTTQRGAVWLWDTEAALGRGLSRLPEPLEAPVVPHGEDTLAAGSGVLLKRLPSGDFVIDSSRPDIATRGLDITGKPEPPRAAAFSRDGAWLAWAAAGGGILLFDLQHADSPVAILGEHKAWSSVRFAEDPDRIVASAPDHDTASWRYFRSVAALTAFARDMLPIDKGERAHLSERDNCMLLGIIPHVSSLAEQQQANCELPPR